MCVSDGSRLDCPVGQRPNAQASAATGVPGPGHRLADGQRRVGRVHVRRRVGPEARAPFQRQVEGALERDAPIRELDADRRDERAAVGLGRDRQVREQPIVPLGDVALPAGIHHGVAQTQQEAVARVLDGDRIVARRHVVPPQPALELVAAVVDAVEDLAVPALHLDRLQHVEGGAELHEPARIARRAVEIHDDGVQRIVRIHFHVHGAVEPLVRTDGAELHAAREGAALLDDDAHDARLGQGGAQDHEQHRAGQPTKQQAPHLRFLPYGRPNVSTVFAAITVTYCAPPAWNVVGLERIPVSAAYWNSCFPLSASKA